MLFWMTAAALTALVTLPTVWPLMRRTGVAAASRAEHDVEVYGAQLAELEADLKRGALLPSEAASARAEIGRRLLKSAGAASFPKPVSGRPALLAATVAVLAPLGAIFVYAGTGSPGMGDRPLAARAGPGAEMAEMIAAAEARLAANPDDARGWDVLAPIYLRIGEVDKAATAFSNALERLGPEPARLAGYGEALTRQAGGEVTGPAREMFERALAADPDMLAARFYLALDASQEDRFEEAAAQWDALIQDSPPDAPWLEIAKAAAADATARRDGAVAGGPTAGDMAAAAELSADDRRAMVAGMVAGLAERLRAQPDDVEGWKRLIRSYAVLGDGEQLRTAVEEARAAFAPASAERREIDALAGEMAAEVAR